MAIVLRSDFHRDTAPVFARAAVSADPADYREFVFRCALAVCGEPEAAEDVAQEVLLTILRTRRLAELDHPLAWVRKVTVRCATKYLRRQRKTAPLTHESAGGEMSTDGMAVLDVLRRLDPEQRALLGMALSQGLTYKEIGDALGIPEGTVASRLSAARKAFQRMWEQ